MDVASLLARPVLDFPQYFKNMRTFDPRPDSQPPMPLFPRRPSTISKRVEFMGMHVSYPQYVRLRRIQREVIRMDRLIRELSSAHDREVLERNPHWRELLALYDALKKMLPQDYLVGEIRKLCLQGGPKEAPHFELIWDPWFSASQHTSENSGKHYYAFSAPFFF